MERENRYIEFLLNNYELILKDRYDPELNTYLWKLGDKELLDKIREIVSTP